MIDYEAVAEKVARDAAKMGYDLDYMPESIDRLEEFLQAIHRIKDSPKFSDDILWNVAVEYGIYLGQTLLRNKLSRLNWKWAELSDGLPVLQDTRKNRMSPITKVYKRLINGPEDSVKSYYEVSIAIATGEIKLP